MLHFPALIQDLALILIAAGLVTILFRRIGQPVVLGYLIAGMLVGPNISLFPTVSDVAGLQVWAEIGVIFLLFGLGLEFSFRKLMQVGASASITAVVRVLGTMAAGYAVGMGLGWSAMDCLFLGGMLSISSTMIAIRALEEEGLRKESFVQMVMGVLVVEDLCAILLLVVLASSGSERAFDGTELLYTAGRLLMFVTVWFVAGILILPMVFKILRRQMNDETLLVVAVGLCFTLVFVAAQAGFSSALGAFMMGSILAESEQAHRIEKLLIPVKDLFGAVFFVSVGMLIAPALLMENLSVIVLLTVVTVAAKLLTTLLGARMAGREWSEALRTGLSLTQIGEFSFIIATLGLTLKVISPALYPIAIGVSVLTTFLTPYLIRSAGFLEARFIRRPRPRAAQG